MVNPDEYSNQVFVLLTSENIRYELNWRVVGDIVVRPYQFLEGPVDCLPLSLLTSRLR